MRREKANRFATALGPGGIAPPPRKVPFTLKTRAVFDEFSAIAWLFLAISSLAIVFARNSDLASFWLFRDGVVSVAGTALDCRDTGSSEGSKHRQVPIYENRYRFRSGDGSHTGVSYAVGDCRRRGAAVVVEHVQGEPDISRIAGMRRARFGADTGFVLVAPLVAFPLVAISLRRGLRRLRLLKHGELAYRRSAGAQETGVAAQEQSFEKRRLASETPVVSREDERGEAILYDPTRPDVALAWSDLDDELRVDRTGALRPVGIRAFLLALPVPLAIAGCVLAFRL